MLIKLDSREHIDVGVLTKKIAVGSEVFRYIFSEAYDKGDVVKIEDSVVTVDFSDTIRSFDSHAFTLVFGNGRDEHWAVFNEGVILEDFRGKKIPPQKIESLNDLLDFDNWMV